MIIDPINDMVEKTHDNKKSASSFSCSVKFI